jgi:hypothetical protein
MKGKLFSVTMLVLALGLALAVPVSAGNTRALTVESWTASSTTSWTATKITWKGYDNAASLAIGATVCDPSDSLDCQNMDSTGNPLSTNAVSITPKAKKYASLTMTWAECDSTSSWSPYVFLLDSNGQVIAKSAFHIKTVGSLCPVT